jgi:hypothetical protein
MEYPTEVKYSSKMKDSQSGKKSNVLIDRTKKFPSRTRAKKFLKDNPLKNYAEMVSEGRPEPVKEEV